MDPRTSSRERALGLAAMVSACSIWGLGPLWIQRLLEYLPAVDVCLYRTALGGLTLLPCLAFYNRRQLAFMVRQPAAWLGGLGMALSMLCYAAALNFIRPAEVNLVFQANIVVSALLGLWLYHESVPRARWAAFAVALTGVALVIFARDEGGGVQTVWVLRLGGMGLGFLGGVGASFVQASMRKVSDARVGLPALLPMHLVALTIFAVASGFEVEWRQAPNADFWRNVLLIGVIGSGVGSLLVNYAIRRISLAQAGVTGSMQPVVTIVVTSLLGQVLPPQGLLGAALVVGGVTASALLERYVRDVREPALHGLAPVTDLPMVEPAEPARAARR